MPVILRVARECKTIHQRHLKAPTVEKKNSDDNSLTRSNTIPKDFGMPNYRMSMAVTPSTGF